MIESAPVVAAPVIEAAAVAEVPPVVERAMPQPVVEALASAPAFEAAPSPVEPSAPVAEAAPIAEAAPQPEAAAVVEIPPVVEEPLAVQAARALEAAVQEPPEVEQPPMSEEPSDAQPVVEAAPAPVEAAAEARHSQEAVTAFAEPSSPESSASTVSADEIELANAGEQPPLAVEQAVALEHALDHEPERPSPHAFPAPGPSEFSSSGSEMPVVLTTPVPHVPTRPSRNAAAWLQIARERLPEAKEWSKKTLKDAPRTLLISAPFIALLGIWAAHGLVTRSHSHTAQAVASPPANAAPTQTTTATALVAPPPVPATAAPSVTPEPATTPTAEAAALEQAQQHGLPALEKLSGQFPADARVSVALANEQARAQRFEAAVGTLDALLTHTPNTDQNGKVMGILWRAAQSAASEPAFVTLRKLGGRGSDVAFDLATTPGVRAAVRERAKTELTQHLASDASDDTRVATALLLAPDCSTRKSLLERADHEGGKRTRTLLEQFSRGAGCTSSSDGACNSCLMSSPVLAHALEHLSAGAKP